ncbi:MAG: hypothetical protein K9K76_11210 [Halanaerobiales bacterium]|nr:hypothetical protein [Halanaerobiales bacterium]
MIEIEIEGHDLYSQYSRKIQVPNLLKVKDLLELLDIPENKRNSILIIIDNKVVSKDYTIKNNEIIKLYSVHFGG